MKHSIIIFGTTSFAKMLKYYIETYTSSTVVAFSVDSKYMNMNSFCNLPVVPFENISSLYSPSDYDIIVALGYSSMNIVRQKKCETLIKLGYNLPNFIHPTVHKENAELGFGNIILENVILGYNSKIGNGNIIWNGCNISHEVTVGNYNYISPSVAIAGRTNICNNCFLGINSCVQNDLIIQNFSLVGAGCCIKKATEAYGVYLPASTIKVPGKRSLEIEI